MRTRRGPRSGCSRSATPSGSGTPRPNGPSCGTSTRARSSRASSLRAFPLSDWTELDIWQYIEREGIELPSIYFSHRRPVDERERHVAGLERMGDPRARGRGAARRLSASGRSATPPVPAPCARRRQRSKRSSRRWPRHGSPSVAPPGPTTASPRPPWRIASARGTSRSWKRPPASRPFGRAGRAQDPKTPATVPGPGSRWTSYGSRRWVGR